MWGHPDRMARAKWAWVGAVPGLSTKKMPGRTAEVGMSWGGTGALQERGTLAGQPEPRWACLECSEGALHLFYFGEMAGAIMSSCVPCWGHTGGDTWGARGLGSLRWQASCGVHALLSSAP